MPRSLERLEQRPSGVATAPAPVLLAHADGTVVDASEALGRMFGYSREELVGRPVDLLFPPGMGSIVRQALAGADGLAVETRREMLGRHREGTLLAIEVRLEPLPGESGVVSRMSVADLNDRLHIGAAGRPARVDHPTWEVNETTEHVPLAREGRRHSGASRIIGQSAVAQRVVNQARQVAATDSTVLLLGETGTGKELFATAIHEQSARRGRAMVRVNCGAIPATLIECELFGREKGAFTGALARQVGRFELADTSTIFLDEIGDLPHDVQVKLLRVLEERTIERLGSSRPIAVDTRIIAATHRNLEQRVQAGLFREDLYYRLNVFPIHVPPLRERTEDVPALVWHMVEEFSRAFGKRIDAIDQDCLAALQQYHWPGNLRELRNLVERAMIVATGRRLTIPLPAVTPTTPRRSARLVDVERAHIHSVLESARWRIRGAGGAAERLALKPTTLETRMARLGLRRPRES
ncbi:hypothetical protein TBR22_A00900 [Luteitalea sp. TBR-22]|uniref:sigma-54 interaction domain-containing protein n=1 Tax=Luteitalea sp. TBR-22 TaxID=2802971 RepID=UPI001EF57314|nr:sigma 54-interacting transcriptional regulator [Luteitalea sp. TBR-22]BCS30889.2 hypothetical protein TBR22_A00900 [Luteitalea sp. TBR-22]